MATKKSSNKKGTGLQGPAIGSAVPKGYVKKKNKDGTISYVPPKKKK